MLFAQTLVGTSPTMRNALLEKFTAINCGNCPAASSVSNTLAMQYGEDLVRINVHGGDLATPSGTQPDFRTTDGAALWTQFNVNFQPQGMISRGGLSGASGWNNAIGSILPQMSPVNVGVASTYGPGSNMIHVEVELYYTADGSAADRIHVALTQDHIFGWQTDYMNGNQPNYDHRNVLRDLITPLEGDPVTNVAAGTLVQRTYSIPLDDAWELADLHVVAFVADAEEVHQTRSVAANGGSTVGVEERSNVFGQAWPVPANDELTIPLLQKVSGVLMIRDLQGRTVKQVAVPSGTNFVRVSVAQLAPGLYTYGTVGGVAERFVVE